jgi:hypothetical protein
MILETGCRKEVRDLFNTSMSGVGISCSPVPGMSGVGIRCSPVRLPFYGKSRNRVQTSAFVVCGSGLAASFVDNDCEIYNILRAMVTATTDVRAGSLKKPVSSRMYVPSEREHGPFWSTVMRRQHLEEEI